VSHAFFLVAGLLFGLASQGGYWSYGMLFGTVSLVIGWLNRHTNHIANSPRTATLRALVTPAEEKPVESSPRFLDPNAPPDEAKEMQGTASHRKFRMEVETELDQDLFQSAHILRTLLPQAHSVLVFFLGARANTLQLRVSDSILPAGIIPYGVVEENQGLVGRLLKQETRRLLEGDAGGTKLYYYKVDVAIQSVAAVPILLNGRIHGALVVDSLEQNAFSEVTVDLLAQAAHVIASLSYQTSMNFLHQWQREQYKELFEYQKKFLHNMSIEDIYKSIRSYVKENIPYDRLMILATDEKDEKQAWVRLADGLDAEFLEHKALTLDGRGLLSICFLKSIELQRTLTPSDQVWRISQDERINPNFRCLIAIPVATDPHEPVRMVVSLESCRLDRYNDHHRELLRNICNAAGFAYARVKAYEERENQAFRDGLTGLPNHRAFQERLRSEMLRTKRISSQLGIVMCDVDKFKNVNDTYGHPVGDLVLKEVAGIIAKTIRADIDQVARYGGEEFVVMLIEATEDIVHDTAERIRRAIEEREIDIQRGGSPLRVTISLGYAMFPRDSEDVKEVLKKADKALYKAKESGRNRVVGYH